MTLRRAVEKAGGLVKSLESVFGAAAAILPPKEVWENEPEVLEEDSVCTATAPPPHTVTSPFTWTMACPRHRCPLIGHPAAQIQSTGVRVVVLEGARTAGIQREGAAVTVGAAPRVLSVETTVLGAHICPSSPLSHLVTAQWT